MRSRAYWLLPDLASARATMDDLLRSGVDVQQMYFVAREDCDMAGLHAAGVLQTSDLVRSAETGLVIGAALGGVLGTLLAVLHPGADGAPQWNLVAMLVLAGALVDAWTASMIGISVPNKELARFAAQIAQGRILLMLDVPVPRVGEIEESLRKLHPEARRQRGEEGMPAFR
jgi:pimeloyl-ACP methyl ester carboxylesterase